MVSCGGSLIKYILFAFNLLWLILGAVILWLGFTIVTFSGEVSDIVEDTFRTGAIVLLVTGFVIFLIAFLGCCGAIKESQCMLWTYGAIILLLVIVQVVGVYFAFKYHTDIETVIKDGIDKHFPQYTNSSKQIDDAINKFQKTFECCGSNNYTDWDHWLKDFHGVYPGSCCDKSFNSGCNAEEIKAKKYQNGCVQKALDKIKIEQVFGGIGGVAIAVILVQLLIVFAACCLVRDIRS